jgi:hypothetical protein
MKRILITKALTRYDTNKGYGRTLIKEEPHIKELRSFHDELKEDILSPGSLQKLALILIGKNTRTDTSESGKTFENLANKLGGYEVLGLLGGAKQLTEENAAFLEKHPVEVKTLAPLILYLSKSTAPATIKIIFNAMEKLKNSQELIAIFTELEGISRRDKVSFFMSTLSLLNNHNLNTDEVMPLLRGTEHFNQIVMINKILKTLADKNPSLITLPNLVNILKIKYHTIFHDLFEILPPDQESLDSLFQSNNTLDNSSRTKDLIANFKKGGWDLHSYLKTILSGKVNGWTLWHATTKLSALKIKAEVLPMILQAIFAHENNSIELVAAVEVLNKEGLDEQFLKLAFEVPAFSHKIAEALITLKKAQCYNETTKLYVCLKPKYAPELAQFWIQFTKVECPNLAPYKADMLRHPQCASYTAAVIDFLRQNELHHENNIISICNAKLTSYALLNLLHTMKEAKLVNQPNFDLIIPRLAFIKTLHSGARCFANAGKLEQLNFETLVADPINAVALAESFGGKPYPQKNIHYINKGAQDFTTIRRNTQILCQGNRQGLFFPAMSQEQIKSFEKTKGKTLAEAQKDILLKIAQYSGNQELEEETKHNIAEQAYKSFLKV